MRKNVQTPISSKVLQKTCALVHAETFFLRFIKSNVTILRYLNEFQKKNKEWDW